ncbi:MAG: HAD family hydrolase [Rhizobiales bacterium]|nr:HAD family hydrolase [Hyphomicrobiales bacterium]
MRFDAIIFDFDGTLVDSAGVKYDSFFELFPPTEKHRAIVKDVLARDPDGSRHAVIPRMVDAMRKGGLAAPEDNHVQRYGEIVEAGVSAAPECPGASDLLARLHGHAKLYIASNTPQEAVRHQAELRGWGRYFDAIFGYPARKVDVVREILERNRIRPDRLAFVGDGISDEEAARANGCVFIRIAEPADLLAAARQLELTHV